MTRRITLQLVAGQSAITLKGGDIDFTTPGAFTVHGATHAFEPGDSAPAELMRLPNSSIQLYDEAFALKDPLGQPLDGPLDVTTGISWAAYANPALRNLIEPILTDFLRRKS